MRDRPRCSGAIWRVLARRGDRVTVGLYQCTGGEEVDRFTSGDPDLPRFLGDRRSSTTPWTEVRGVLRTTSPANGIT
jgi:hypothetical protein